jgi:hypothetical protein
MKLYLHIGWHKTGSTALQRFLATQRDALRAAGVDYPEAGMIATAHHPAAWSLQEPLRSAWARRIGFARQAEALFAEIFEESARRGARALILSSEEFSLHETYRLERLARVLEGHDVTVVAYVRRQDRYLESLYGQMVKMAFIRLATDFERFVETRLRRGDLDYGNVFARWAQVFGRERLQVRVYDRSRLHRQDVRADFLRLVGLGDAIALPAGVRDDNESLKRESVLFLRRVNAAELEGGQHLRVVQALRAVEAQSNAPAAPLLDAAARLRLLARLDAGNRRFAREFLGDETALQPSLQELLEHEPVPPYGMREFLGTLAAVLPRLRERAQQAA